MFDISKVQWVSADGISRSYEDMDTDHLVNIIHHMSTHIHRYRLRQKDIEITIARVCKDRGVSMEYIMCGPYEVGSQEKREMIKIVRERGASKDVIIEACARISPIDIMDKWLSDAV